MDDNAKPAPTTGAASQRYIEAVGACGAIVVASSPDVAAGSVVWEWEQRPAA